MQRDFEETCKRLSISRLSCWSAGKKESDIYVFKLLTPCSFSGIPGPGAPGTAQCKTRGGRQGSQLTREKKPFSCRKACFLQPLQRPRRQRPLCVPEVQQCTSSHMNLPSLRSLCYKSSVCNHSHRQCRYENPEWPMTEILTEASEVLLGACAGSG